MCLKSKKFPIIVHWIHILHAHATLDDLRHSTVGIKN